MQAAHPVVVAAMGRHPGWPSVIDAFGRINATAHMARRVVFEHGLSLAAARGVWDKVPEAHRLDGLTHDVLWLPAAGEGQSGPGAVGRVWMSRDASGRTGPMMVLACVESAPVSWVAEQALPRLAAVEKMCRETNSPELVRLSIGEAQHEIEDTLAMLVGAARPGESDEELLAALAVGEWGGGPREECCARVVQAVEQGATHVRVPRELEAVRALRAWGAFVRGLVTDTRAVLVMARDRAAYVDVFIGGPDAKALTVLRANEGHTPLTTAASEAPTAKAIQTAATRLRTMAKGTGRASPRPAQREGDGSPRGLPLLLAGGVLVAGVAAWLVLSREKKQGEPRATLPRLSPLVLEGGARPEVPPSPSASAPELDARAEAAARRALTDRLATIDERVESLEGELADQGAPVDASLRERAASLRSRLAKGEAPGAMEDDAGELQREVDASLGEAAGRVLAYLKEQASRPPTDVPVEARDAWSSRVMKIAPREGLANAKREIAGIRTALGDAARSVARAFELDIPASAPVDVGALRAAAASRKDQAVRAAAKGEAWDQSWPESARRAVEAATHVDGALRDGLMLDEEHAGRPLREWAAQLEHAAGDAEIGASVAGVRGRLQDLAGVDALREPGALLDAVERAGGAAGGRVSEARTAWHRLASQPWPMVPDDFATLARVRNSILAPALGAMPDAGARARANEGVDADARAMWKSAVERVVRDERFLRAAMAVMAGVGVTELDVAALPEWAQFSIARTRLSDALDSADADAVQASARAMFREGAQKERVWPALQTHRPRIDAISHAAYRVTMPERGASLAALGPGALGWTLSRSEEGVLTYTSPGGVRVSFVQPERGTRTAPQTRVSYLSTTEVTVAMAAAVAADPAHTDALRAALPDYRLDASDPRLGARTWGWAKSARGAWNIGVPETWQRPLTAAKPGGDVGPFAPGVTSAAPTDDAPVQYVSPQGACAIAAGLGCRLASVDEWLRAAKGIDANAGNLRDSQFATHATWVKAAGAGAGIAAPTTDIFRPANSQRITASDDVEPAVTTDDGLLWFESVASESAKHGPFRHLVGNAAEFVVADASGLVEGVAPAPEALAVAGVRVIGGSALSRGYLTLEPQPVDLPRAANGYSDVGFRIAFTAPANASATSPEQELREALAKQSAIFPGE
jgi:hypothetical protein